MRSFTVSLRGLALGGLVSSLAMLPAVAHADDPPDSEGSDEVVDHTEGEAIYGGTDVPSCGWPTTVSLGGCTGTLVHPQVVIFAAHCPSPNSVRFGESAQGGPGRSVGVQACNSNPAYGGASGRDQAYCVLSEPQLDIPIVPPLMGCEASILAPGKEVTIVGFGNADTGPFGIKRQVTTTINNVANDEAFIGGGGKDSCQGDSGGPVYVQLNENGADGSWRVFGITSYGGACGGGGYYSMMHTQMDWIEGELSQYDIDITPCFTSDGTWQPGPDCFGFPTDPATPSGNWNDGCTGGPRSGYSSICGTPFNAEPDETPPTVEIVMPETGSIYDSMGETAKVTIVATADDGDGWGVQEVQLMIDGEVIENGAVFQAPYEWEPWFPSGGYEISARAIDYAGNEGEATPIVIGVDQEPPEPPEPEDTGEGEEGGDGGGDGGIGSETGSGIDDLEFTGCSCSATPTKRGLPLMAMGLLGLLAIRRRRSLG